MQFNQALVHKLAEIRTGCGGNLASPAGSATLFAGSADRTSTSAGTHDFRVTVPDKHEIGRHAGLRPGSGMAQLRPSPAMRASSTVLAALPHGYDFPAIQADGAGFARDAHRRRDGFGQGFGAIKVTLACVSLPGEGDDDPGAGRFPAPPCGTVWPFAVTLAIPVRLARSRIVGLPVCPASGSPSSRCRRPSVAVGDGGTPDRRLIPI